MQIARVMFKRQTLIYLKCNSLFIGHYFPLLNQTLAETDNDFQKKKKRIVCAKICQIFSTDYFFT